MEFIKNFISCSYALYKERSYLGAKLKKKNFNENKIKKITSHILSAENKSVEMENLQKRHKHLFKFLQVITFQWSNPVNKTRSLIAHFYDAHPNFKKNVLGSDQVSKVQQTPENRTKKPTTRWSSSLDSGKFASNESNASGLRKESFKLLNLGSPSAEVKPLATKPEPSGKVHKEQKVVLPLNPVQVKPAQTIEPAKPEPSGKVHKEQKVVLPLNPVQVKPAQTIEPEKILVELETPKQGLDKALDEANEKNAEDAVSTAKAVRKKSFSVLLAKDSQQNSEEERIELNNFKEQLLNFYFIQDAKLRDLKAKKDLNLAERKELMRLEDSQVSRLLAVSKDQWSYSRRISWKKAHELREVVCANPFTELAFLLNKTVPEVRGIVIGQTALKVMHSHLAELISILSSIDLNHFEDKDREVLGQLMEMKEAVTFDQLAAILGTSHINAALWLNNIVRKARKRDPLGIEALERTCDEEVAKELKIDKSTLDQWLGELLSLRKVKEKLTVLGKEERQNKDYESEIKSIFTRAKIDNGINPLTIYWFFTIGNPEHAYEKPEEQWKVFINPRAAEFYSTLERTIKALKDNNISASGKIISSDTLKRNSNLSALDDPCEPKMVLYFKGPQAAEDLKRAMVVLEREFRVDGDLIAAPVGERKWSDGRVVQQRGPSFTKNRNNLMFYDQGGYVESGRINIVQKYKKNPEQLDAKLKKHFEGENFYLHKGYSDPLIDIPSEIESFDRFLDDLEAHKNNLNTPLDLIKLQNMINLLGKEQPPISEETEQRINRLEAVIHHVTKNLSQKGRHSLHQILQYQGGLGSVQKAFSKELLQKVVQVEASLDRNKPILEAQLEFVSHAAKATLDLLENHLQRLQEGELPANEEFNKLMEALPTTCKNIFCGLLGDEVKEDFQKKLFDFVTGNIDKYINSHGAKSSLKKIEVALSNYKNLSPIKLEERKKKLLDEIKRSQIAIRDKGLGLYSVFMYRYSILEPSQLIGSLLQHEYVGPQGNEELKKIYGGDLQFSLQDLKLNPQQYRDILKILKTRLENVYNRQQMRLKDLKAGNPVSVPVFFHAAPLEALTGIAKTGVEVTPAAKGFGAYVATEPELSYGPVAFGFSEAIAFKEANDYVTNYRGHTAQGGKDTFWVSFKEMLEVQPTTLQVRNKFFEALRLVLRERIQKHAASLRLEEQIDFEESILNSCELRLAFRVIEGGTEESEKAGSLQLMVRNDKGVSPIESDKDFEKIFDNAYQFNKLNPKIKSNFLEGFAESLREAYGSPFSESKSFSIPNWPKSRMKTTITAMDDDLEEYFKKLYVQVQGYRPNKAFASMKDIKQGLQESGFDLDQVEFIPHTEQYLERDFRKDFQELPKEWDPSNY